MDEGIANLSQRVARLQLALNNAKEESIVSQLSKLKSQLRELNANHPELKTLISLADHYHVQPLNNEEHPISDLVKEEDIQIHYDNIIDTHRDMVEVVNMEPDSIINDINTRLAETSIASLWQMNALHNQQVEEIYRYYTMLVTKSMIVYEKYVQHAVYVNEFWLRVDERLTKMTQLVDKMEREKQELHRY